MALLWSWNDRWGKRTLGTGEDTAIGTPLERTVKLAGEGCVGDIAKVVVGLNVFLEGLAAVAHALLSANARLKL